MLHKVFTSVALGLMLTAAPAVARTAAHKTQPDAYSIRRIPLPGAGRGDYLFADATGRHLYVTHGRMVHVLNLDTLKPIAEVTGLGASHGVALDRAGRAYVTDGNSNSVIVFDPDTGRTLARIATGKKPDSILFDPASAMILAFDGGSNQVSVIDPAKAAVVKTISLPEPPENAQADGRGHVYVNLEEGNSVAVLDTGRMALDRVIPLAGCDGPAPLAIDVANNRLFSGCGNKVMVATDPVSGKVVAAVPIGSDPDGIVFDPASKRIFVANRDGEWTVVRETNPDRYAVDKTLKIDEYAKTVALDPATHRVFSSTADLIWPPAEPGKKRLPDGKPGTFRLLVVAPR